MKNSRGLLRRAWWLLPLGLLFVPAFPSPPLRSGVYVQNVTRDTAVIAKIEPADASLRLVVEGGDGPRAPQVSPAKRRHAFLVDNLAPGTEYTFTVSDEDERVLDSGRFKTAPARDEDPVRFSVVGDSGKLPWWIWMQNNPVVHFLARNEWLAPHPVPTRVGTLMAEGKPDFWLHVGDIIYPRGENRHWSAGFFRPFAELLKISPCYAVLGNHDLMNDDGRQCLANLHLPTNPLTGDERFFSFAWGSVRVVGLDLARPIVPGSVALDYLDAELSRSSEPWSIVVSHYPPYSASRQTDRKDMLEHVIPLLEKHEVDLVLAGHDHNYQRFGKPDELGPVCIVSGAGGKSLYDLKAHPKATETYRGYHFCRVDVVGRLLRFEVIATNGELIEVFEMDLAERASARRGLDPERPRDRRIQALL